MHVPTRCAILRLSEVMPAIVLAVLTAAAGCTKFDLLNATIPSLGYQRTADQAYGPLPRQKLDVYRPRQATRDAKVVVFFYGGAWQSGEKADYRFVAEALSSQGFIAVIPDYRLYPAVRFPAFVEDGALAIRWVHDNARHFGGDPQQIFLMGHSAGAHIAAMLNLDGRYLQNAGLDPHIIAGTAALSGPYDFVPRPSDLAVFGMSPGDTPDQEIEPIHFVDGNDPPMLLVQGMRDTIVDPGNATRLAARIRGAGGDARCALYPDREHTDVVLSLAGPFRWLAPTLKDVTRFIHEHPVRSTASDVRERSADLYTATELRHE